MRSHGAKMALVGLAVISACARGTTTPPDGAAAGGATTQGEAQPTAAVAEPEPVRAAEPWRGAIAIGTSLYFSSKGDASLKLPSLHDGVKVERELLVEVVGEQDGRLVVETLPSIPDDASGCVGVLHGFSGLRLRWFVAPDQVAAAPTEGPPPGKCASTAVERPASTARATDYSRAEADILDSAVGGEAAGWGMAKPGYQRPIHDAKAGTAIVWADGSPAGTVVADYVLWVPSYVVEDRTCFDVSVNGAPQLVTSLCFASGDVARREPDEDIAPIGMGGGGGTGSGYGRGSGAGFGGRGRKVPRVRQAKAEVTGALEPDIVRRVVRAHINEVRHCYSFGLDRDPSLAGRLEIRFTIGPDGTVSSADVATSTLTDPKVGECVARMTKRWRFPKPGDGSVVRVLYPFVLEPG